MTATPDTDVRIFRILVADELALEGLNFIRAQEDTELVSKPGLSEQQYAQIIGEHDALIVRSGVRVTAAMLRNPGRLKIIARAGVGVDNIDVEAATQKGVLVVNTAEASTITTAEHAFALIMAVLRNLGPAYRTMIAGGWDRRHFQGRQLSGNTLGIIGFGRIGQTVAKRALAFNMNVLAFDPFINAETMLEGRVKMFRDFMDLLPHADILTFHVPLNDSTRGMLNARTFEICRDGVYVVNVARGGVVDEQDLITALDSGRCSGAALDVFREEPLAADHPLRSHPQVLVTPHLGASTHEAQQAVSINAAEACLSYLRSEGIQGAVNAGGLQIDLSTMQRCYVDLGDRMARLISPMVTDGFGKVTIMIAGEQLAAGQGLIERTVLCGLLREHLSDPVNIINVNSVAESRSIQVRTVLCEANSADELVLEIEEPARAMGRTRRVVGRVYDDGKPRVVEINGYHLDMVPAGDMLLIQNEDRPGMIGLVGTRIGAAGVNIADMSISRRETPEGITAMMVLRIDAPILGAQLDDLKSQMGILKVAALRLPPE